MASDTKGSSAVEALLKEKRKFAPPKEFVKRANVNRDSIYAEAARNPARFWERFARELDWFKPWKTTLQWKARKQCAVSHGRVCGQVLYVPIVEAPGETGVGRFGWKNQQASLLSFSCDAYLNEMGITNRLFPDEVTNLCNTAQEPNDKPGPDGLLCTI